MQDDFKSRYICPKCGTKVRISSGHCPKCGFIGPMEHKGIRLRKTNANGQTVTVPPPTMGQETQNQRTSQAPDIASRYTCPRCGATTNKAYGRCPNRRSCGYTGAMQPRDFHQQPNNNITSPDQSRPQQPAP